ncbi:unnamed protein product [Effrenium voratum]|nr:unnamed protein product [Effrenium voratum]
MTMVLGASAAHGLDNNWTVMVTGMKDGNGCMKATSVEDMGSNIVTSTPTCLSATQMCADDYECTTAQSLKPASFTGCTFDESTAAATSVVGVLMDGLCYTNFVVEQKNFNGAPGLAPDKVHVRSEAHLHTRACLVVSYCAKTGFYLLTRPSSTADYAFAAQMDSSSAEKALEQLDPEALLKELVSPTGAWKGWSSQLHHHDRVLGQALGAFLQYQQPEAIIDMGCGLGFYVSLLRARGLSCDGFDGHADTERLTEGMCYHADFADPELPGKIAEKGYDWCVCLEVFEHVPKSLESQLVDCLLAGARKGLVLSVATPGQGGLGHVNEQTHEYVVELLENRGLVLDEKSHLRLRQYCELPWFRQNLLVFRRPTENDTAER